MNTISWKNATTPLPMEINPRVVFERMFGRPGTSQQRLARMADRPEHPRLAAEERQGMSKGLGGKDRNRLNDYLENVREIEPRIQKAEKQRRPTWRCRTRRSASGVVRGARRADVRPAGARVRGQHHARLHLHEVTRRQPARVSEHRRHRAAPRDVASRQQLREARRTW